MDGCPLAARGARGRWEARSQLLALERPKAVLPVPAAPALAQMQDPSMGHVPPIGDPWKETWVGRPADKQPKRSEAEIAEAWVATPADDRVEVENYDELHCFLNELGQLTLTLVRDAGGLASIYGTEGPWHGNQWSNPLIVNQDADLMWMMEYLHDTAPTDPWNESDEEPADESDDTLTNVPMEFRRARLRRDGRGIEADYGQPGRRASLRRVMRLGHADVVRCLNGGPAQIVTTT